MVINQYKAKGPLTSMLLSVVAIDDAVALIAFGLATTVVKAMNSTVNTNMVMSILSPVYEIAVSFVLGGLAGILMKLVFRWFKKPSNRICIILALVLATYWIADLVHGSPLLACMALGAVLTNIYDEIEKIVSTCDSFTPPLYMIFFVFQGRDSKFQLLRALV